MIVCKITTFILQLAQAVELLFDRLDTMNGYCIHRFASWFAYHLSNFQFRWGWDDWSLSLKKENLHPKPKFIAEALGFCLRLGYHAKILESVPQTFHRLAPPQPIPKNKFMTGGKAKSSEDNEGDEEMADKEKAAEEKEKEKEEEAEPKEELPGTAQAIALHTALIERCTPEEALELLNGISSNSAMESDDGKSQSYFISSFLT